MIILQQSQPGQHDWDIVCLSHLRWNGVFQRPQHLLTRAANTRRILFFEEPRDSDEPPRVDLTYPSRNVTVATPQVSKRLKGALLTSALRLLLDLVLRQQAFSEYVLWYYTPMALPFSQHLNARATVYDCMDQLSAFAQAPPELVPLEHALMAGSDAVFTGGQSLFELKRGAHANVHCFPSGVDLAHFHTARVLTEEPLDQQGIPHPRLGYFGVIDERLDLALIAAVAQARPEWHLVLVGPIAKIDESHLPHRANIHYLGQKRYEELPAYLAGWDVALMPFARNESTRYISPTKTPEYLAAGKPVVSTSIRDVVRTYGARGFVRIADHVEPFLAAVEDSFLEDTFPRRGHVDQFLSQQSWDGTWGRMHRILDGLVKPIKTAGKVA